jgi:hypothetical protein
MPKDSDLKSQPSVNKTGKLTCLQKNQNLNKLSETAGNQQLMPIDEKFKGKSGFK